MCDAGQPPAPPGGSPRAAAARARRDGVVEALAKTNADIIARALRVGYLPYVLPWPARRHPEDPAEEGTCVDTRAHGICERDYSQTSPDAQLRAHRLLGRFLHETTESNRRAIGEALLHPVRASERDLTDFLDRFDSESSGICCQRKHPERDLETGACKRCDAIHVHDVVAGLLWTPNVSDEGELLQSPRDLNAIPMLSRAGNPRDWMDARDRGAERELQILERVLTPLPRGPPAPGGTPLPRPPVIPPLRPTDHVRLDGADAATVGFAPTPAQSAHDVTASVLGQCGLFLQHQCARGRRCNRMHLMPEHQLDISEFLPTEELNPTQWFSGDPESEVHG
eukprot:gene10788-3959_t